jgi:hypothetical protein
MVNGTGQDFSIRIDVPKYMMSGPYTAALEDGTQLVVTENSTDSSVRSLIITGKRQDSGRMDMTGMRSAGMQHAHSIVISATNVVPEFQGGLISMAAALAIMGVMLAAKRHLFFSAGKTY